MKGYKGFKPGLICRDKQYAENTVFEEENVKICKSGMHFCKNPFDVLDYYDLVNADGSFNDFAEVEALDEAKTDDNKKYCTKKLKIGAKLSFAGFVKACVDFVIKKTTINKNDVDNTVSDCNESKSGNDAKIGSSGVGAQIGSSGIGAQIGSSGDGAKIGSSGIDAQISSSGNDAKIGSSGVGAKIGSSGNGAQIGSSGNGAQIGSSGNDAQIGSSGNDAKIGSSGNGAKIGSSGDGAKIGSSGNYAQIGSSGKKCVICCAGNNCSVKAKKGSWITLAEWKWKEVEYVPVCVKTEFVDGERIKEDVLYKLVDGEFVEAG